MNHNNTVEKIHAPMPTAKTPRLREQLQQQQQQYDSAVSYIKQQTINALDALATLKGGRSQPQQVEEYCIRIGRYPRRGIPDAMIGIIILNFESKLQSRSFGGDKQKASDFLEKFEAIKTKKVDPPHGRGVAITGMNVENKKADITKNKEGYTFEDEEFDNKDQQPSSLQKLALNQNILYCVDDVRYMEAFRIFNFPIYGVSIVGPLITFCCVWLPKAGEVSAYTAVDCIY